MIAEYKKKTNLAIGIALLIPLVAYLIGGDSPIVKNFALLISAPIFIYGCIMFAIGKGHSGYLGLLGLLNLLGLIILVILPDKNKNKNK